MKPRCGIIAALLAGILFGPANPAAAAPPVATPAAPPAAADSGASHNEPGGIDWFAGSVDAAFIAAQTAHKPVFLYWGAKWCPPCQQLKSSVFNRSDFIEKSRQFIAVYLDGDAPRAQKWGESFHVTGYPTVLVLGADKRELLRLTGGLDLAQYAEVLDTALGDIESIDQILAKLDAGQPPAPDACARLAYNGWVFGDYSDAQRHTVAQSLQRAAQACTSLDAVEHARLVIESAVLDATDAAVTQIIAIVHDPSVAPALAGTLEFLQWDKQALEKVKARGSPTADTFAADWIRIMDATANNPATIDAEQLDALDAKLAVVKMFSSDDKIPPAVANAARSRVTAALDKRYSAYARTAVVNSAAGIYDVLDDQDAMYTLLTSEMKTSATPFYYMRDLGELEEQRGHTAQALQWYERAYHDSTGIATRYQWGRAYLDALVRLAPTEHKKIRYVGVEVVGELDGPDRIHGRTRGSLQKLDAQLRKWNGAHHYDADVAAIHQRMGGICKKLPPADSSRATCKAFLS